MNFLKDKVRKYQEKKLEEANQKLKYHSEIKNKLETLVNVGLGYIGQLKSEENDQFSEIKKNIEKQKEFIKIWGKNIETIKKQIKKLKS